MSPKPPLRRETPLQVLRADRGISLRELAERTGISRGLLSLYERGRYIPSPEQMVRIMEVLSAPIVVADQVIAADQAAGEESLP